MLLAIGHARGSQRECQRHRVKHPYSAPKPCLPRASESGQQPGLPDNSEHELHLVHPGTNTQHQRRNYTTSNTNQQCTKQMLSANKIPYRAIARDGSEGLPHRHLRWARATDRILLAEEQDGYDSFSWSFPPNRPSCPPQARPANAPNRNLLQLFRSGLVVRGIRTPQSNYTMDCRQDPTAAGFKPSTGLAEDSVKTAATGRWPEDARTMGQTAAPPQQHKAGTSRLAPAACTIDNRLDSTLALSSRHYRLGRAHGGGPGFPRSGDTTHSQHIFRCKSV
ncbi:hypothetical protein CMUS01_08300 [Colletotrichum musicola]|uniref:Uncharacterized protein n=1 Tax=Colletotrichum musicola TaxID=2175873 RepID=A0A8H6KCD9_9PEZI|nr:hypothetical protein CMUS01_08300 [Colletotrichum musicola]